MSLATALSELALDRRLSWEEVERLLELANADTERAVADVEFDAWWNGHVVWTRQRMAVFETVGKLLRPQGKVV
jgi:hypothetical protein